jgi:hypothetical protein
MKRQGCCKLTIEQEKQVIQEYQSGKSARQLAKDYGFASHNSITAMLKHYGIEQRSAPERNRLYKLNPNLFDVIDSERKAYWWGFIYADGNVHKRSLIVAIKWSDISHVKKLKSFMQSESPIKRTKRLNTDNARIGFTDRHLADRLRELGILPNRPRFELVPRNLPQELVHHWIRGYFDGDGSAKKNKAISFVGQIPLLEFLRSTFANKCNTNPNLSIYKHSKSYIHYLCISGRIQALKVYRYMYKSATVWLGRKKQVIESWPKPKQRKRDDKGRYI